MTFSAQLYNIVGACIFAVGFTLLFVISGTSHTRRLIRQQRAYVAERHRLAQKERAAPARTQKTPQQELTGELAEVLLAEVRDANDARIPRDRLRWTMSPEWRDEVRQLPAAWRPSMSLDGTDRLHGIRVTVTDDAGFPQLTSGPLPCPSYGTPTWCRAECVTGASCPKFDY